MILYKKDFINGKRDRKRKDVKIKLEEYPERPLPKISTAKDRMKTIKGIEMIVRGSIEYKTYIKFLRENVDMNRCAILKNIKNENGKKYRIEIHHEPFTLFDIVDVVLTKRYECGESLTQMAIADEVMELHYSGNVGLIPLSVTMHELVHNGRIFIPLQYIYQKYDNFYNEYKEYIEENPALLDRITAKVDLSMKSDNILSDVLTPEFAYTHIDGFEFPEVPDEWKDILHDSDSTYSVKKDSKETTLVIS